MAQAISDENTNILSTDVRSEGPLCAGTFVLEVRNLRQLDKVIRSMSKVKGVHRVLRKGEVVSE